MAIGLGATLGGGSSDLITTGCTSQPSQRSWSCWYNRRAGSSGTLRFWAKRASASSATTEESGRIAVAAPAIQFFRGYSTTNGVWSAPTSGTGTATGTWFHLVITYDSGLLTNVPAIYVNGVAQTVATTATPVGTANTNSDGITIGSTAASSAPFDGGMAEFGVWNRLLTAGEALALSTGLAPIALPGSLVCYVPLAGGTVIDYCGTPPTVTGTTYQAHPAVVPRMPRGRSRYVLDSHGAASTVSPVGAGTGEAGGASALQLLTQPSGADSPAATGASSLAIVLSPVGIELPPAGFATTTALLSPMGASRVGAAGIDTIALQTATSGAPSGEAEGSPVLALVMSSAGAATREGEGIGAAAPVVSPAATELPDAGQVAAQLFLAASGASAAEASGVPSLALTLATSGIPTGEQGGASAAALLLGPQGAEGVEGGGAAVELAVAAAGADAVDLAPGAGVALLGFTTIGAPLEDAYGAPSVPLVLTASGLPDRDAYGIGLLVAPPAAIFGGPVLLVTTPQDAAVPTVSARDASVPTFAGRDAVVNVVLTTSEVDP